MVERFIAPVLKTGEVLKPPWVRIPPPPPFFGWYSNPEIAIRLFKLVNFIATKMITGPAEIHQIYGGLPPGKLDGIAQRDAKSKSKQA